jgi:hypothetical protein
MREASQIIHRHDSKFRSFRIQVSVLVLPNKLRQNDGKLAACKKRIVFQIIPGEYKYIPNSKVQPISAK